MATAIVAHRMTAVSDLSVNLEPICHAMVVIVVPIPVFIGRNRSTHRSTDTRPDDRALATTDFGAECATQGAANAATNRRIKRLIIAGGSREAEQQAYREEQTLELHCRVSVTQDTARVSQMSPRKTGNQSHSGREVIQKSERGRHRRLSS